MTGMITGLQNHGTIITMVVENPTETRVVHFDHRMFHHFVDGSGGDPRALLGREVEVTGNRFDDECVRFPNHEED